MPASPERMGARPARGPELITRGNGKRNHGAYVKIALRVRNLGQSPVIHIFAAYAVLPPSTTMIEPVVKLEASDARYSAAPAISSGWAWRLSGMPCSATL